MCNDKQIGFYTLTHFTRQLFFHNAVPYLEKKFDIEWQ